MDILVGDTSANRIVNASDIGETKAQIGADTFNLEFPHRCDGERRD